MTGPLLATYTGVLLADTAVPAWHEAYRHLPFLFAGGAMTSAGAAGLAASGRADRADRGPAAGWPCSARRSRWRPPTTWSAAWA